MRAGCSLVDVTSFLGEEPGSFGQRFVFQGERFDKGQSFHFWGCRLLHFFQLSEV
jgi:hypothetical protein